MSTPTIVIVGRMNVGKSTLFNRIIGSATALVSPIAGTTRDWQEAQTQWQGTALRIIDTGGVEQLPKRKERDLGMQAAIERSAKRAITKADAIIFVVDGKEGLLPQDRDLARLILRKQKPIILAVNKIDSPHGRNAALAFWKLGCGEPQPIAALTGAGVGDLLEIVLKKLKHKNIKTPDNIQLTTDNLQPKPLRIAVIGKPNVGKSSLVNALLGEERVIVSPIAGTTREPIDTDFERDGKRYTLIDTAGIRRHAERTRSLEGVGVERTIKALYRTDVALLVFESQEALASQDMRIAATLVDNTVGVVIIANKWDLFQIESRKSKVESQNNGDETKKYTEYIRRHMPHIAWAPILFVSATTNRNVQKILAVVESAAHERKKMIPEATLVAWLRRLTYRPHKNKSERNVRTPHIYGIKQSGECPPTFELVTEFKVVPTKRGMQKETVRDSYIRFLENQLRASFGFTGTPIVVKVKTIE
ncbi:ribosome biogenesis GTPase Der [Candidatus Uhrbacteria bacterium]|nr:ribosome biogenesis GTPase Der [Candidatus Uhrbacteria bacterium]